MRVLTLPDSSDGDVIAAHVAVPEHYQPPDPPHLQVLVIAKDPDVSGNPELFASGRATLVLPEDAPRSPQGVPELRAGTGGRVDLAALVAQLDGQVVVLEGGPRIAGQMLALGPVDEFFHTVAPMAISGDSARLAHGPAADPTPWDLSHGFCDDAGYLFLRYARP